MKEKHSHYFAVEEAFKQDVCPVCFLVRNHIEKYYQTLLYENINDIGFRKKFREDFGFCHYHAYKFLSYKNPLAVGLIHKDLLEDIIEELSNNKLKNLIKKIKNECIICKLISQSQQMYIEVIYEYLPDSQFQEVILNNSYLCVPHLTLLLKRYGFRIPEWFITHHLKKYSQLYETLIKFNESYNFCSTKKISLTPQQKMIWYSVVERLYGLKEIFSISDVFN